MDLKMEVYSPFLELLGLLEIQNSVMWRTKAFSGGSFSLNALITEESKSLLVPENIIWISGDQAGIIEYIQQQSGENGPYITVKGCDLTGILSRAILWGRYDLRGTVPEIMYRLVDSCCIHPNRGPAESRVIPGLTLAGEAPPGGPSIRTQKTGANLLEALEELGAAYNVSFGVRFNPVVPQMEFWARYGVNRAVNQSAVEPVFYSTELDDVLSSEYSYNAQNYRNVALVTGEGEGDNRVMITVNAGGTVEPLKIAEFIPNGETSALRTSDGKRFTVHAVSEEEVYRSVYTGPQIDEAVRKALSGGETAGVSSFNRRTGAVVSVAGDYAAKQVSFSGGSSGLNARNVQDAIFELFTSVSEGKSLIASAITDKGVDTAADAAFSTMRDHILAIPSGGGSVSPFQFVESATSILSGVDVFDSVCVSFQNIKGVI